MSIQLTDFLQAIMNDPSSAHNSWLVLADWLEDQSDPRFELVRLQHDKNYLSQISSSARDTRILELLAGGMDPIVPTMTNTIGMPFALIPAGMFLMGSPDGEGGSDGYPQHEVEITQSFYMGVFQVTQAEYGRVVGNNPSYFCSSGGGARKVHKLDTTRFPVELVSWEEAKQFCEKLSNLPNEKKAGRVYRLPTEAEWEYACRGGAATYSPYFFGFSLSPKQANFNESGLQRTSALGSYPANSFGLQDMHGNVWEWCLDVYDAAFYTKNPIKDPQLTQDEARRVLRGGSWDDDAAFCRSVCRYWSDPGVSDYFIGFRVVLLLDF